MQQPIYLRIVLSRRIQGNASNCHVVLSIDDQISVKVNSTYVENEKNEKRLGFEIDKNLRFEKDVDYIWKGDSNHHCPI